MRVIWILLVMIGVIRGQEWYMPNSHLISDTDFPTMINQDRSTFKMVKYFSQNCIYCRYLKVVVDQLKSQKQWCFQIYDLNCGWYNQFCYVNVHATSFPYTAVYDGNGEIFQSITGFYPEPVMRTIFQRVEETCLEYKRGLQPVVEEQKVMEIKSSLTSHEETPTAVEEKIIEPIAKEEIKEVELPHQQIKLQQVKKDSQQQVKKESVNSVQTPVQTSGHEQRSMFSYVFYGVCSLIGGYYVYHIHTTSQPQQVKVASVGGTQGTSSPQATSSQVKNQQSELLASLPDDQL